MSIANMTPEQRAVALEKARIAKAEKSAEWRANAHLLQNSFADAGYWRKLASKFNVRMPGDTTPGAELRIVRRAMKRLEITPQEVRDSFGGDVKHLHAMNPTWPAYALIGLLLEMKQEKVGGGDD